MNSLRSPFTKHGQLAKRPECDNLDRNLHYRFPYPRDAARDHGVHDPFFSFLPLPSAGGNSFHRKHDATVRSPARNFVELHNSEVQHSPSPEATGSVAR